MAAEEAEAAVVGVAETVIIAAGAAVVTEATTVVEADTVAQGKTKMASSSRRARSQSRDVTTTGAVAGATAVTAVVVAAAVATGREEIAAARDPKLPTQGKRQSLRLPNRRLRRRIEEIEEKKRGRIRCKYSRKSAKHVSILEDD